MINPTTQAGSQFNSPFNILPDTLYTNPTVSGISQFATPLLLGQINTFNILPDTIFTNPTVAAAAQFATSLTLGPVTTFNYVTSNDVITPNTMLPSMQQFATPLTLGPVTTFNYTTSNDFSPNPTVGAIQFSPSIVLGTQPTFNYTSNNDFIPNPTNGVAQFTPTTVLGNQTTFNYTSSNDFILNPFIAINANPQSGLALLSGSTKNPTLFNNTWGHGAVNPGVAVQIPAGETIIVSQFQPNSPATSITVDPAVGINTNISPKSTVGNVLGYASTFAGSILGIPQIGQVGQAASGIFDSTNTYLTLAKDRLRRLPGIKYADFRSRFTFPRGSLFEETNATFETSNQTLAYFTSRRLDGLAASTRLGMEKSAKSIIYAAAAASPLGPYSVFNLDGFANTGYGWGDHDNPDAFRNDFTIRSHVATVWTPSTTPTVYDFTEIDPSTGNTLYKSTLVYNGDWTPTRNPTELITPFLGDKVTVIDFGQRALKEAYRWKPKRAIDLFDKQSLTQDFIKFYLTGPKLHNGTRNFSIPDLTSAEDPNTDDIIVFRAHITNFDDSFSANWTPVNMVGRADPNYTYTGFTRDVSVSFDVYATDRDEVKPIWRKLNALAGYTAPTYDNESIAMIAPWMRLTLGDIFVQQPVTLTSVSYTFGMDAPWEINIEEDPTMMQVPLKIGVSLQFNMIGDYLPEKGGRFYTLAKRFNDVGIAKRGSDNWLSELPDNVDTIAKQKENKASNKPKTVTMKNSSKPKTATIKN
jgi:hypothetical protein